MSQCNRDLHAYELASIWIRLAIGRTLRENPAHMESLYIWAGKRRDMIPRPEFVSKGRRIQHDSNSHHHDLT